MVADHYWATSYALTGKDLFTKFDYSKLKISPEQYPYPYTSVYRNFLAKVFKYFFYLVLVDIIEHNIIFRFPRTLRAFLEMDVISNEDFIKARLNGAFLDVDFLASNYTGYILCLRYNTRYGKWTKAIHVTEKYKNRITELTNLGHGW